MTLKAGQTRTKTLPDGTVLRVQLTGGALKSGQGSSSYTGPSVAVMRKRVANLEATIERQKREGAAKGMRGVARKGNPDTVAALNHARRVLAKAEAAEKSTPGKGR